MTRPYFITTAISYPNGPPHIGHAYEAIATDVIARFHRLAGKEVYFLTGTDDHGQKMFQTARDQNMTPLELADQLTPRFRDMVSAFKCSNDELAQMGFLGRKLVEEKYQWPRISERILYFYGWILNGGAKPDFVL